MCTVCNPTVQEDRDSVHLHPSVDVVKPGKTSVRIVGSHGTSVKSSPVIIVFRDKCITSDESNITSLLPGERDARPRNSYSDGRCNCICAICCGCWSSSLSPPLLLLLSYTKLDMINVCALPCARSETGAIAMRSPICHPICMGSCIVWITVSFI